MMKMTIDTEVDDFESVLRAVYAAYGRPHPGEQPASAEAHQTTSETGLLPGGWTEQKLRQWAGLLTKDAQEIVRYIAAHAPEVPWDDVMLHYTAFKHLDEPVQGVYIGGVMSSGGHALNRLRGAPKNPPLERDYGQRLYLMDVRIAGVLAAELGRPAGEA